MDLWVSIAIGSLTLVMGLGGWFAASRHAGQVELRVRQGLEPLGLRIRGRTFGETAWAEGELEGVPLEVVYTEPAPRVRNEVQIPVQATLRIVARVAGTLPEGMELCSQDFAQEILLSMGAKEIQIGHPQLDHLLRIQGKDERLIRSFLLGPEVADALLRVAGNTRVDLSLKGQRLEVKERATDRIEPASTVQAVARLARILGEAQDGPWRETARARNLRLASAGPDGGWALSGRVAEVDLKVQLGFQRETTERRQTRIHASIDPPLPGGLRLRLASGARGGLTTGNPIMDQLVDVQATDPAAALALLRDEALIEPLMALLHGHPGSYIHPRGLVLVAPGWLCEELLAAIDLSVELAGELGRAARGHRGARSTSASS